MKRYLVRMLICLALTAAQAFALEPAAPPSPAESSADAKYSVTRDDKEWVNVFVGHYGETLHLYTDWTAEAVMRGPMEVVYMREKILPAPSKWPTTVTRSTQGATVIFHPPLFQIEPDDYIPENFARLRLMQLMVIPKNVPGGFRSLGKLREAKEKELSASGNPYELKRLGDYNWPPDSFWVSISTPYRLYQLYTQSDKNFFILTSGASPHNAHPDDQILTSATEKLYSSLGTYLDDYRLQIIAEEGFVNDLRIALRPWAAVCTFAALLAFLPKRRNWLRRLRLIGRATFGFTCAWHLLAGPLLFAAWRLGLDRAINDASIMLCAGLIMPWICKSVSIRLGGQRPWRVLIWSAIANILPVFLGYDDMSGFIAGTKFITGSQNFLSLSLALGIVGLLNGVVIGLTHQEDENRGLPESAS